MRLDEVSLSESLLLLAWSLAPVAISDGGRCAITIRIPSRLSPLSRHCYSSHRLEFITFTRSEPCFSWSRSFLVLENGLGFLWTTPEERMGPKTEVRSRGKETHSSGMRTVLSF